MSKRFAAIVGSILGTNSYQSKLRDDYRQDSIDLISDALSSLGPDYTFELVGNRGYFKDPAAKTIRHVIEKLPSPAKDAVFLLYYHGHVSIDLDSMCVLGFREVSKDPQPSNAKLKQCSLERIVECASAHGFCRIVVILDSCYSAKGVTSFQGMDGDWACLSSTGDEAQFQRSSSNRFTREIARVLKDADLRSEIVAPGETSLTLAGLHAYLSKTVGGQIGFDPHLSGPLSDFAIAPVDIKIPSALNERAPAKSLYIKLFRIGRIVGAKTSPISFSTIKSQLKTDPSFLVTDRTGARVLISDGTLLGYMNIGVLLDLWIAKSPQSWVSNDSRLIDQYGSRFNDHIVSGALEYLPEGVDVSGIRKCARDILRQDLEPTYFRIQGELHDRFGSWRGNLEPKYMRIIIRLLGYSYVLRRASPDTFFPR